MKKYIVIYSVLILFVTIKLKGQSITFEYLLSTPQDEFLFDIVEASDSNIFFCGWLSSPLQPKIQKGLLVKLNNYGEFVDSNILTYPDKSINVIRLLSGNSENYTMVSIIFDSVGSYQNGNIFLSTMDESLNIFNNSIFAFPPTYRFDHLSAQLEANGNLLVGGAIETINNHNPWPFIYEFNSVFDSLKARFYFDSNDIGIILKLKALPDSNYWIIKALRRRYELLDPSFNVITTQKIPDYLSGNLGVKWDTDTSFYLVGDKLLPEPSHNLGFIRQYHPMDTTGHLFNQWGVSDTVDFPAVWNGIDFKNKDSIFIGGTRNFWLGDYNNWPSWFIVLQTDSMLNIRWERFYGGDAYYLMCKIIAANDGGCFVAGTRYDYLHTTEQERDIIILKLNSEGLITGNEEKPSIKMQEAIVFPNPGTSEIKVRVAAQYSQSVFKLYDINGKLVLTRNITGKWGEANTAFLNPGTYIYRITSNDGLYESGKWVKQ